MIRDRRTDSRRSEGPCGSPTNPLLRDTDGDRALDRAECSIGTNPNSAASSPSASQCAAQVGGSTTADTDGDRIRDYIEYCYYNSNAFNADSAGDKALDGAKDGCEATSFNPDRIINVADMGMLAAAISNPPLRHVNLDVNKDGVWNPADQGLVASFIGGGQYPG